MATLGQGSNACSVLNSYHAGCQYEMVEECGPPHDKQFVFKVEILGVAYTGKGSSKKRAKQAAAASALRSIYNINLSLGMETPAASSSPAATSLVVPPPQPAGASLASSGETNGTTNDGSAKVKLDNWASTGAPGKYYICTISTLSKLSSYASPQQTALMSNSCMCKATSS